MRRMKTAKNVIEFISDETVRKIGIVPEKSRPHRLKVEAWALSQVRERGVNVPQVISYSRDTEGREVLVLERVRGRFLSMRASEENIQSILDVGRQMTLLSDVSVNYGWVDPDSMAGRSESWRSFIESYTQVYGEQIVKERIIKENYLQAVYEVIEDVDLSIPSSYLVNRDLRPSHLIRDDSGKVWILDWENVILGDPLYDLALFGVRYGHGALWQNLKSGYGFEYLPRKYLLYEIAALMGIIDFFRKNNMSYQEKVKQLQRLIGSF